MYIIYQYKFKEKLKKMRMNSLEKIIQTQNICNRNDNILIVGIPEYNHRTRVLKNEI